MNSLWAMLANELGSAWTRQYGSTKDAAFKLWTNDLSSFTEKDLFNGLESFKKSGSTYISLNVFRKHCSGSKPEVAGVGFESAFTAIIARTWENIHPAFQNVAREREGCVVKYDMYALKAMKEPDARKFVRRLYDEVTGRLESGEVFERVKMISGSPSGTVLKKRTKTGMDALENMKKMMGVR